MNLIPLADAGTYEVGTTPLSNIWQSVYGIDTYEEYDNIVVERKKSY